MSRNARDLLQRIMADKRFVCVGLDSDEEKVPVFLAPILRRPDQILLFNQSIIDSTKHIAGAYKLNLAFYAKLGPEGIRILERTCAYIRAAAPDALIILDAKYGDIGNTNLGYVLFAFERCGADAVTLHPYMGEESLLPFLDQEDKLCIILAKTSNPGSKEFQDRRVFLTDSELSWAVSARIQLEYHGQPYASMPLYQLVAFRAAHLWAARERCGFVAGATFADEIARVRMVAPSSLLLVPGAQAQAGDLEASVRAAAGTSKNPLFFINSSRGIIFASSTIDFAQQAARSAEELHTGIHTVLA
jgi:orotidine-5'-phosphate decarboxylase